MYIMLSLSKLHPIRKNQALVESSTRRKNETRFVIFPKSKQQCHVSYIIISPHLFQVKLFKSD